MNKKLTALFLVILMILPFNGMAMAAEKSNEINALEEGENQFVSDKAVRLPEHAINFKNSRSKFKSIVIAQKEAIYYFDDNKIKVYDVSQNTVKTLYYYLDVVDVYVDETKMYVLCNGKTSGVYELDTFDSLSEKITSTVKISNPEYKTIYAVGVDKRGRFYLATDAGTGNKGYRIYLYSSEWVQLSSVEEEEEIYRFNGFDETNGNFYYEGYLKWVYWGYNHDVDALKCGNVTDNKITIGNQYMDLLFQQGFTNHYDSAQMLNNQYLVWTSTLKDTLNVMKSNEFCLSQETLPMIGIISRKGYEKSFYESVGTRMVYYAGNDSFIMYANGNELIELNKECKEQSAYQTVYPVFSLLNYGENILAIEKSEDGEYFIENLNWKQPTKIELSQVEARMQAGETLSLTATHDSILKQNLKWTSSDVAIASVSSDGIVYANKSGTAKITVTTQNGKTAECTITVMEDADVSSIETCITLNGSTEENRSANNYINWTSIPNSNLYQDSSGALIRVEHTKNGILVETYTEDGKTLQTSKTLEQELDLYGGCYLGTQSNFLVFGQKNEQESDTAEVIRIVKYTKDWERVNESKIYGANTYIPFDAGALRMMELDGKLYLYTCHEMYAQKDNPAIHHQANMLFTIDEETMETADSMFGISNLNEGYVSHSFNQFIKTDGTWIYRVDHSEASDIAMGGANLSVNGITLTKYLKNKESTNVRVTVPVKLDIHKGNYTGASVGGFEIGGNSCLIAYNKDISNSCDRRNIYISVTDCMFNETKTVALTEYTKEDYITCYTPQIVKMKEHLFLVLWEEYNESTKEKNGRIMMIDEQGNVISKSAETAFGLSDCQPIMGRDGNVKWYVTEQGVTKLYSISPYHLDLLKKPEKILNYTITDSNVKKIPDAIYNGKQLRPVPVVTVENKCLKAGTDYTVQYGTNKIGKGTVTIKGEGIYKGSVTKTFSIYPRKTSIIVKTVAKGTAQIRVSKRKEADKYQVQFAKDAKFKSTKTITTKSLKSRFKGKSKKIYYVRVRTMRTVGGKKYVSQWTATKKIRLK